MRAGVKTRKLYVSVLGEVYNAVLYRHHESLRSGMLMVMMVLRPVGSNRDAILDPSRNKFPLTPASISETSTWLGRYPAGGSF